MKTEIAMWDCIKGDPDRMGEEWGKIASWKKELETDDREHSERTMRGSKDNWKRISL